MRGKNVSPSLANEYEILEGRRPGGVLIKMITCVVLQTKKGRSEFGEKNLTLKATS
jgi:hypothetical protein